MRTVSYAVLALGIVFGVGAWAQDQSEQLASVHFQNGPSVGNLGGIAIINVPAGYVFAGAEDARKLMEAMQNPVGGTEMGLVGPPDLMWFVLFEYDDVGYVKDDEKADLDAAAMLKSIKQGNEASNKERADRGWARIDITGWEQPPRYDVTTNNLEWAVGATSEGSAITNFNTRLLGRSGVMRVTLVTDPATLPQILPDFRTVLQGYQFSEGNKYAEYRPGDKVAKYGLTALVVGGASAVAVKAGLFKWLWKGIAVALVAVSAFLKNLFGRNKT